MNIEPIPSVSTSHRIRRIVRDVAIAVIATISIAACSSGASDKPTTADTREGTVSTTASSPTLPTATVGPGRGTAFFSVQPDPVPVTFTMPAGWEVWDLWFVAKSDADQEFGLMFFVVANIYADGCQWVLSDPPVGPTVDDLVSAWANVPGLAATAPVDITVDGYAGKQIELTVPDYGETECKESKFGLWQDDGPPETRAGSQPNRWAQGPNQHSQLWILDVDGTRVVIEAFSFPDTSPQDRAALDEMLASIQIG